MKTIKREFKFKCGDILKHKADDSYGTRLLVLARGIFEDADGLFGVMYNVSFSHMGQVGRGYINEVELELYPVKKV